MLSYRYDDREAGEAAVGMQAMQREIDEMMSGFAVGYFSPLANLARLTEEVGELAREINHHYGEKPKRSDEPPGSLALELGDILFVVGCLANSLGIDLDEAFAQTMDKYRRRDAGRWGEKPR